MATKIVYEDKVALSTKPGIADKNKITASDMNAIKTSVNELVDESKDNNMFKNLFNVGNSILRGASVTFSNTDNQIKINGASTTESNIFLDSPSGNKDKEGIILKAGTYTATIRKISGSLANNLVGFYLRKSDGTSIYNGTSVFTQNLGADVSDGTVYSKTFALTEETRLHWVGFFNEAPITFYNLVLQFQIEEGGSSTSYTPWAGYIVESGSNSTGSWIKFSDGTMICWGYNSYAWQSFELEGNVYISNELTLELPQEFKSGTLTNWKVIEVHTISGSGIYWCTASYFKSDKIAGIRFAKATSGNSDIYFDYIAIGKWK